MPGILERRIKGETLKTGRVLKRKISKKKLQVFNNSQKIEKRANPNLCL